MRSQFLIVPKAKGEAVRKNLLEIDALNKEVRIESDDENIFIPLNRVVDLGFEVAERDARTIRTRPRSYEELVEVPDEMRSLLPKSFDVVGSVLVLKLAEELLSFSEENLELSRATSFRL
ncbi:MAG: hypothetical protein ACE5IJ_10740, partial [Thermoplasmata archaeon]